MCINLSDPIRDVFETLGACTVVCENYSLGTSIISLCYCSKPFLTGSIPNLYFDVLTIQINRPNFEVDSYTKIKVNIFFYHLIWFILTYGGYMRILKVFLAESEKKAGLSDARVPNDNQF